MSNTTYVLICAGIALLVAIFPTFFLKLDWMDPVPSDVIDTAHVLYFLLLSAVLLRVWPWLRRQPLLKQIIIVTLLSAVAGGTIELAQQLTARSPSFSDVGMNVIGAMVAVAFLSPARRSLRRHRLAALQGVLVVIAVAALWPAIVFGIDVWNAQRRFPMLADFETPFSHYRVSRGHAVIAPAPNGSPALRVDTSRRRFSGVQILPLVTDWNGYEALKMRVYVEGDTRLPLTVSIVDRHHYARGGEYEDRYNHEFRLQPGWNEIRIPLHEVAQAPHERAMDMTGIIAINLFVASPRAPRRIYLDDVQLLQNGDGKPPGQDGGTKQKPGNGRQPPGDES